MNAQIEMLPAVLAEFLLKSAAVVALVSIFIIAARKFSPSQKHQWWMLAFVFCVILPVLFLFPKWKILPSLAKPKADFVRIVPIGTPAEPQVPPLPMNFPTEKMESGLKVSAPVFFAWLWTAGCGFLLLRSALVALLLRRLGRAGRPVPSRIEKRFADLRSGMSSDREVRLFLSREVTSPFTWGVWRPQIALPESALDWPDEDLEMILLHELEHVRRRDAVAVLLSNAFLSLNWVNPLAWFAHRQAARCREDACDEAVLRRGHAYDKYADLLYRQAKRASRSFLSPGAAAVAECGTLGKRIRDLLSHEGARKSIEGRALTATLTGTLVIVVAGVAVVGIREASAADPETKVIHTQSGFDEIADEKPTEVDDSELMTNAYVVWPGILAEGDTIYRDAKEMLEKNGVEFGPGRGAIIDPKSNQMIVRNTRMQHDRVIKYLESRRPTDASAKTAPPANAFPEKGPDLLAMERKLREIVLPEVELTNCP